MANTLHQLKRATEIVERYRARGNAFPRELRDCGRGDPANQQEYRDACKVKTWKYSLLGKNIYNCSDEIRDYLDANMPGWSDRVYSHQGQSSTVQMQKAQLIVTRYKERGCILPRRLKDPTKAQETKDAINISTWKSSLKGYNRVTCSKELCSFLDDNMPGWRLDHHKSKPRSALGKEKARRAQLAGTTIVELDKKERSAELLMPVARGIVERFYNNNNQYPSLKLVCRQDPSRSQEYADAKQLHSWKSHTDKTIAPEVFQYLDTHMSEWKNSHISPAVKNMPISKAREIFNRCTLRNGALPQLASSFTTDRGLILEHNDALILRDWRIHWEKKPLKFNAPLKTFLDENLSEWCNICTQTPIPFDLKAENKRKRSLSASSNQEKMKMANLTTARKSAYCRSLSVSTDGENSTDGSNYDSDDEDSRQSQLEGGKRTKLFSTCQDSDECAGIAALLQLSAGGNYSPPLSQQSISQSLQGITTISPLPTPLFLAHPTITAFTPTTVSAMSIPTSKYSSLIYPVPASCSTYGNGGDKHHSAQGTASQLPLSAKSGLELYLTSVVGSCS